MVQEKIAIGIVLVTLFSFMMRAYRTYLAPYFSKWLLRKGSIKWAMKVRSQISDPEGCSKCKA